MTKGWWPLRTRFSATRTTQCATPLTSGGNDSVMIAILMSTRSPTTCSNSAKTPLRADELSVTISTGRSRAAPAAPGRTPRSPVLAPCVAGTHASLTLAGAPLSVLDLAPIPEGGTAGEALRATIELARQAERLGFTRFWVAEHHGMPGIASSSPPVLIATLASATSSIRIGSGGVMLPNHTSLVVAEQFGMLEALHPGRIDLGIGRAPGTDQATAAALRHRGPGHSPVKKPSRSVSWRGPGHVAARLQRLQRAGGRHAWPAVRVR